MTRKDYVLIAAALKSTKPVPPTNATLDTRVAGAMAWGRTAAYLTDALASDNPRFDRERFLKACGVQS